MKKYRQTALLAAVLMLCLCLAGCNKPVKAPAPATPEPTQTPEPTPTPEPVFTLPDGRELKLGTESLDLSGLSGADVQAYADILSQLPMLKSIEVGAADERMSPAELKALMAALPEAEFSGSFTFMGETHALGDAFDLDLSVLNRNCIPEVCEYLPLFRNVGYIDFGSQYRNDYTFEDIASVEAAAPNASYNWDFAIYGLPLNINSRKINLSHVVVGDNGELVKTAMRIMPYVDYLDMDWSGVEDEYMAEIRDEFPQVEVVWRVWFGDIYSVRTNEVKLMASLGYVTNDNCESLKYCTKLKYLDLGHNDYLTDFSFLNYMPDLEVLVTCQCSSVTDISPIANLKKLEYLELISAEKLTDLSPLAGLTNLRHLNICNMFELTDITPLYNLTNLERLWIGRRTDGIPPEQIEEFHRRVPNCWINTTTYDATDDPDDTGWRYNYVDEVNGSEYCDRYLLLREQFGYDYAPYCYNLSIYDPLYFSKAPTPEE